MLNEYLEKLEQKHSPFSDMSLDIFTVKLVASRLIKTSYGVAKFLYLHIQLTIFKKSSLVVWICQKDTSLANEFLAFPDLCKADATSLQNLWKTNLEKLHCQPCKSMEVV